MGLVVGCPPEGGWVHQPMGQQLWWVRGGEGPQPLRRSLFGGETLQLLQLLCNCSVVV
jgi:hypothetical protein